MKLRLPRKLKKQVKKSMGMVGYKLFLLASYTNEYLKRVNKNL